MTDVKAIAKEVVKELKRGQSIVVTASDIALMCATCSQTRLSRLASHWSKAAPAATFARTWKDGSSASSKTKAGLPCKLFEHKERPQ